MEQSRTEKIKNRIELLQNECAPATLIAVTKYYPIVDIESALKTSQRDFGESKVQELKEKSLVLQHTPDIRWHFIGNLQRNKVSTLFTVKSLYAVHSLDSIKLYDEMLKHADSLHRPINLFIQVNTSNEQEKGGISYANLNELLDYIKEHQNKNLQLHGLMTMGSIRAESFESAAHFSFKRLKEIKREILDQRGFEFKLSMGMSDDYKISLSYQTDYVRIGGAIFA